MKLIILALPLITSCSMLTPPSGTHYTVKYHEIEVTVDDYTDREGIQFEYVAGDTKIVLKKESVDSATPLGALSEQQAKNQAKLLDIAAKVLNR